MQILDITRPLEERVVLWQGQRPPVFSWVSSITRGAHCNASEIQMSVHTGTHMDAPLHFEEEGTAIHQIPCDVYVGKCTVLDLASTGSLVMDRELASNFQGVERLLIRTRHSYADVAGPYEPHEALMTAEAASLLLDYGMVLIGTDRLSVDGSGGSDFSLHRRILKAECAILEGLLLAGVEPGQYFLCAAPLPLLRREASPVRALLLDVDFAAKEVVPSE